MRGEIYRGIHFFNAYAGQSKTHLGIGQNREGKKLADAV